MIQNSEKRASVVTSLDACEQLDAQEQLNRGWQAVDRIRERNAGKDPEEEMAFITEVVEEVRQERYDAAQHKTKRRS